MNLICYPKNFVLGMNICRTPQSHNEIAATQIIQVKLLAY